MLAPACAPRVRATGRRCARCHHAGRGAAAPRAGPGARQRHPGVGPNLPHLPGRPPAQVPPLRAGARHLRRGRRRAHRRAPSAPEDRDLAAGVLGAYLPSSSRCASSRRSSTPRISCARSTSSPPSISSSTRRCSPRRRPTSATCTTRIASATTCGCFADPRRPARASSTTSCSICSGGAALSRAGAQDARRRRSRCATRRRRDLRRRPRLVLAAVAGPAAARELPAGGACGSRRAPGGGVHVAIDVRARGRD